MNSARASGVASVTGCRISNRYACCGGPDQLGERQAAEPLGRRPRARHRAVRSGRGRADVEHLHGVAEVDVDRAQRRMRCVRRQAAAGRLGEEVQQDGRLPGRRHQHVPARAEPGEHRLGDERGEHGRQGGVHRVPPGAEDLRAGVGGDGMARGDDAAHRSGSQNLGMNSGTSTSMRVSRRGSCRFMRLTRGEREARGRAPGLHEPAGEPRGWRSSP